MRTKKLDLIQSLKVAGHSRHREAALAAVANQKLALRRWGWIAMMAGKGLGARRRSLHAKKQQARPGGLAARSRKYGPPSLSGAGPKLD